MSIKIAGVDLFSQGLDNEFRITVLEKVVDKILSKQPTILSKDEYNQIRKEVVANLQKKYPEAGIQLVEGKNE
jgi:hypothetical protein